MPNDLNNANLIIYSNFKSIMKNNKEPTVIINQAYYAIFLFMPTNL